MIRKSAMLFFLGGALLVLLTLIFYTGANQIPETVRMPVALIIPIIVLFGMVIGCHFARQNYLGRVLELNQLEEGEYECNKNTGWMISLKETYEKEKLNPRFILVRKPPSIDEIPLGMDFTLTVSTESGKETRSGEKKPERFTRRLFKARWKNPEAKGGLAETRWSTDVK
ncbi:hypothetical protein KJ665_02270 [Patescibacteria group bacterium]|nr:hypothetical protein [Patescibacteria group bacterium]